MEPMTLGLTALSGGLSFLGGLGGQQAAKKQNRMQLLQDLADYQMNDNITREADAGNLIRAREVNAERERLGRELLTIPEETIFEDATWSRSGIDLPAFMLAGELAGYNPVTWLRSGALSMFQTNQNGGYTRTTRTGHNAADAYKMMMPDLPLFTPALKGSTTVNKVPSSMEVFANAGNAALSTYKDLYKMEASQTFQTQLLDRQLTALAQRASGGGSTIGGSFGPAVTVGGAAGVAGGLSSGGRSGKDDNVWPGMHQSSPQLWENKQPEATNPFPPNWGWKIPPGYANAETWEDTFGEPISWPYGVLKFMDTAAYNIAGRTVTGALSDAWNRTPEGVISQSMRNAFGGGPNGTRYSGTPYSRGSMSP